jgi:hypothetical protein
MGQFRLLVDGAFGAPDVPGTRSSRFARPYEADSGVARNLGSG